MRLPRRCAIDANVFVSATVRQESHHADSLAFLRQIHTGRIRAISPTLVITETVAAISRPTGDALLASQGRSIIETLPGIHLTPLDLRIAGVAADVASAHRLRGADAVYLAVAHENGATLVTWDKELLERGPAVVPTMTPADWLRDQTT
jgi:predicted nucleic acid-binding protein